MRYKRLKSNLECQINDLRSLIEIVATRVTSLEDRLDYEPVMKLDASNPQYFEGLKSAIAASHEQVVQTKLEEYCPRPPAQEPWISAELYMLTQPDDTVIMEAECRGAIIIHVNEIAAMTPLSSGHLLIILSNGYRVKVTDTIEQVMEKVREVSNAHKS